MNGAGFSSMAILVPFGRSQRYQKASGLNLTLFLSDTLKPRLPELEYHGICGIFFLLLLRPG